ncbi:MAG TPA: PA14 domain-containing protein [Verrucomicrobiae bacterium]
MRRLFFGLLLSLAATSWAGEGTLVTSSGQEYRGTIDADHNQFRIQNPDGKLTCVPLHDLLRLQLTNSGETNATDTSKVHGVTATYYTGKELNGAKVVRIDPAIDFDWQEKPPFAMNAGESFSVRWEGELDAPLSEEYTFFVQGNDRLKLWLDHQLVIDGEVDPAATESSGKIRLEAGKRHPFRLEFYEKNWSASAKLFWSSPSIARALVPSEALYTAPIPESDANSQTNGILGMYFHSGDLKGELKTRIDANIDFDWDDNAPIPGWDSPPFSIRWEGKLVPESSEPYVFELSTEQPARLWLNDYLLIDTRRDKTDELTTTPIDLKAEESYEFRLEISDVPAQGMVRLFWSSPSISRCVVPTQQLVPAKAPPLPPATPKKPAGLVLVDGSILAQPIETADSTAIRVKGSARPISMVNVSRILLQPVENELDQKICTNRQGILLANRDFLGGDLNWLDPKYVNVGSILFGKKEFERGKVLAICLHECSPSPAPAKFQVRTTKGSQIKADSVRIQGTNLLVESSIIPALEIPFADLAELKTDAAQSVEKQASAKRPDN